MVLRRRVEVVSDSEEEVLGLEAAQDELAKAELVLAKKRKAKKAAERQEAKAKRPRAGVSSTASSSQLPAPGHKGKATTKDQARLAGQQAIDNFFFKLNSKQGSPRETEKKARKKNTVSSLDACQYRKHRL